MVLSKFVTPTQAGVPCGLKWDARLRGHDVSVEERLEA
jgi:hypothetical protein